MKKMLLALLLATQGIAGFTQEIPKLKIADVEKAINTETPGVLVVNFWATFCKPCVAEIPSFIAITDKYKTDGVKLLLVSLDLYSYYPARINNFAKKNNWNTNIAWLDETNADYFCPKIDSSWSGSIPATLIVNTKTGYRKFFEEQMEAGEFEREIKLAITSKSK